MQHVHKTRPTTNNIILSWWTQDTSCVKRGRRNLQKNIETKANSFCVTNLVPTFKTEAERDCGEARVRPTATRLRRTILRWRSEKVDTIAVSESVEDANDETKKDKINLKKQQNTNQAHMAAIATAKRDVNIYLQGRE